MKRLRTPQLVAAAAIFMLAGLGCAATPQKAPGNVSELDTASLLADVRTLSSPEYGGRFTGSEGNRLAQEHIKRRFSEIGLAPFGASFAQPFAFTQINRAGKEVKFSSATNLIAHIRG